LQLHVSELHQKLRAVNFEAFIPIIVVGLAILLITVITFFQTKKARANLVALGDKLGLKLETEGKYFKKYRLTGLLRGKPVTIFSYTTGSGKSKRTWAAISSRPNASGWLTFSLKRRMTIFEFVAKLFRKNSIETGDAAFDKKWVLTTNRPDFLRMALLPELREKIMRLSGGSMASGYYKCELSMVQYAEQGSFSSEKLCTRFGELAGLVCDLAAMVEVGAELQK